MLQLKNDCVIGIHRSYKFLNANMLTVELISVADA